MNLKYLIGIFFKTWLQNNSPWIIALFHGNFWKYRQNVKEKRRAKPPRLYMAYLDKFNAFIGINAKINSVPTFPHGLCGVFISNSATLGKNIIIYQHVTIGSNTIKESKNYGAPTIEDGVLIGAGAKIIGKVTIGENTRIGAGCVVSKSVPANSVVVMTSPRIIEKEELTNSFIPNPGNLF